MTVRNLAKTLIAATALLLTISHTVSAQEAQQGQEPKAAVSMKQITGTVSGLSARHLSVLYSSDPERGASLEAAFNLDKDVRVIHKQSLKEIAVGDTVSVAYEETVTRTAEGKSMRSTKVKSITFLKPAPKELIAQEEPASPQAAESQKDSLPLKGPKGR